MDIVEYELLTRVEAGGAPSIPHDEYLKARMLQFRARGLVRLVTPEDGDYLPGSCELTPAGRELLGRHRMLLALSDRPERRRARLAPKGKLWPARLALYPALLAHPWYPLHTALRPDPQYVWLVTAHGTTRVRRTDVELRGS